MASPSDLTVAQWQLLELLLPAQKPRATPSSDRLNTGCQWRMLPREFPPYSTVYLYNCSWQVEGGLERIDRELNRQGRQQAGKHEYPAAIAVDA